MRVLATAKQKGSVNVLAPVVKELQSRGHEVTAYATGNEDEAAGFGVRIQPATEDYQSLVRGYDAVLVGMSGSKTPDGYFLRAANQAGIPTIAVLDQNTGYVHRLGTEMAGLPTILAVMSDECKDLARTEMGDLGEEVAKRSRTIGWIAFDGYAALRSNFSPAKREELLSSIGVDLDGKVRVHFTQNMHPLSDYMKRVTWPDAEKVTDYEYELRVTQATFAAASDLGLKLVVKPHPGEAYTSNETLALVERHGFKYVPARACNTQQLMLAADSITAGRSTCLTEACLLDRNVGGVLPDAEEKWVKAFPPVEIGAIPYAHKWEEVAGIIRLVALPMAEEQQRLGENRKKFSVDGKAAQRLADLVEEFR